MTSYFSGCSLNRAENELELNHFQKPGTIVVHFHMESQMFRTALDLQRTLQRIDGRGYPAYKDLRGSYRFDDFTLSLDHIQGDPFAAPTRVRVRLPMQIAGFPQDTRSSHSRQVALRDFIARAFSTECTTVSDPDFGSGKSGLIAMARPGQEILERSSVIVTDEFVEARFVVGLPARGRRVMGHQAANILCRSIPRIVGATLKYGHLDPERLQAHLDAAEDADTLRQALPALGLIAFVADGSHLPRRSGVDYRPLRDSQAVPFRTPESLRIEITLPHAGQVSGMGIPKGLTLIVGGGYHGKSTLLSALELGVYNHIPGDGRELVVSDPSAVKIRSEDGRRIERVDIRPFINNLPGHQTAGAFCTDNASGSTSQAANIIEALDAGTKLLLLDEDTCATNLMIRDARMQALVEKSGEPITPFIDRAHQLADDKDISSILVLGGSGDYFDVADTVIRMDTYIPYDVSEKAHNIATQYPTGRQVEVVGAWPEPAARIPLAESLNPRKGKRAVSIKGRKLDAIFFGTEEIDVGAVAQLVDEGQVRAIGQALDLARQQFMNNERSVATVVQAVMEEISRHGLDALDRRETGDYVAFRPYEFAAALNRLRTLKVRS
jgi:predicted ABC-class ATPase